MSCRSILTEDVKHAYLTKLALVRVVCEKLISCWPVQVCEGALPRTRTVFVGQTAGGEFFAMCACVVLQVRGARGPTEDGGAEEPGALRACEWVGWLVTTTVYMLLLQNK